MDTFSTTHKYDGDEYCSPLVVSDGAHLQITVTVLDVNDNAPVFLVSGEVSLMVSEGVNTGQTLFTVQAMDADIGSNGEVTYSLLGGNGMQEIDVYMYASNYHFVLLHIYSICLL